MNLSSTSDKVVNRSRFKKYFFISVFPLGYVFFILFWEYTGSFLFDLFSSWSRKIYRLLYAREGEIFEIPPHADSFINLLLCWLSIFVVILCLYLSVRNNYFKIGIRITLAMHILLLVAIGVSML